jgi:hypothetical protein
MVLVTLQRVGIMACRYVVYASEWASSSPEQAVGINLSAIQLSRDFDGLRAGDIHLKTFTFTPQFAQLVNIHHPLLEY